MADFRRFLIVLAAVALLLGTITTASAAAGAHDACIASGANPTQLRAEGLTEKTGDVAHYLHRRYPHGRGSQMWFPRQHSRSS